MKRNLFINGSSIIETVIAISIITLCSLIAINLYARIINGTPPSKKFEYEFQLQKLIDQTNASKDQTPGVFKFEGYSIEKRVAMYNLNNQLKEVTFLIVNNENTTIYKMLVIEDNEL